MPAPFERLFALLQNIEAHLAHLVRIQGDMATTVRFQRGGYDGPFLRARSYNVGTTPVRISEGGGGEGRTLADAGAITLLVEVLGTGNAGDLLYIGHDRNNTRTALRVAANQPQTLIQGRPLRLILDRNQSIYAWGAGNNPASEVQIQIIVREGKA